jgi:chemotaxis protein histidine kinase CheA
MKTMDDDSKVEVITPPDNLKDKVKPDGSGGVDDKVLARVEAVVPSMGGDFVLWAEKDLKSLQQALASLKSETADQKKFLNTIFQISHDIKGQGGSFDFGLLTAVGDSLCRFTEEREKANAAEIEAIKLHVEALKLVLKERLKGDGGEMGAALLNGLRQVVDKLS